MPSHYTHGPDYLDKDKKKGTIVKKKKFNYKEAKAILDKQTASHEKGLAEARKKDRIRNEKKKREAIAIKLVEEQEKKSGIGIVKSQAKVKNSKAVPKNTKSKAVKIKREAVKVKREAYKKKK